MADFAKLSAALLKINADLGSAKQAIAALTGADADDPKLVKALAAADALGELLAKRLKEAQVTPEERDRKIAELKVQIKALEVERSSEPDFDVRIVIGHDIARLNLVLADWQAGEAFAFDALLDPDKIQLKDVLEQAAADVQARHDLERVLSGVQMLMSAAAFAAAVAAKLAAVA